jgi:hypothetical protein
MTFWDSCGGNTWPMVRIQSEKCEINTYLLGQPRESVKNNLEVVFSDILLTCPGGAVDDWTFIIAEVDGFCDHTYEYNIEGRLKRTIEAGNFICLFLPDRHFVRPPKLHSGEVWGALAFDPLQKG